MNKLDYVGYIKNKHNLHNLLLCADISSFNTFKKLQAYLFKLKQTTDDIEQYFNQ